MASFLDYLLPQNSGLTPEQMDYASRSGLLNAATQIADLSAARPGPKASVMQLLTHGLSGYQGGAQGALNQFYQNGDLQAKGAADAVSTELSKQDLDWQKKNGSFDAYKKNRSSLSDPTKLASWYTPPAPVADKLAVSGSPPIGARNNNPGNIRYNAANNWVGQTGQDGGFATFDTPEHGARAMSKLISNYGNQGINTIDGIIARYAPAGDRNDPNAYADAVSKATGLPRNVSLNMDDPDVQQKLLNAMQSVELGKGNTFPASVMNSGIAMAHGGAPQPDPAQLAQLSPAAGNPQPVAPQPVSDSNDLASYYQYLGDRQLHSGKGGGAELMQLGAQLTPGYRQKNGEVTFADWQAMTPEQQKNYVQFKTAWKPSGSSAGLFATGGADESLTGDDYLATLPPQMQSVVKLIANGDEKSSTILSRMKAEDKVAILDAVSRYKSDYSANQFGANKEFDYGKHGDIIRSLKVGTSHLDVLSGLADALDNGDMKMFNSIGNKWSTETGGEAPTDFETAKQVVADEIIKAVIGAGGTGADREHAAEVISAAQSPAQLKGAIRTYKMLMQGQLNGIKQQWKTSTHSKEDFDTHFGMGDIAASDDTSPPDDAFVKNAKAHGYSDAEIQDYLRKKNGK
jgi:hypothetical protein